MLERIQKVDEDTNELIDRVQKYLFSIGVRTSKERAWEIFRGVYHMPYEILVERNDKIKYQGSGVHLTYSKQGSQILTLRGIGRFELKAMSAQSKREKKASIRFSPSERIENWVEESIKVVDDGEV